MYKERGMNVNRVDQLLNQAKELADAAGKKAGETLEVSKLKFENFKINSQIQKAYEKLGSFVYKMHKNGEENQELIDVCMEEIDDLYAQLALNEEKINESRRRSKCPVCGTLNALEALYCMKCGEKMPQKNEKTYVEMQIPAEDFPVETPDE